MKPAANAHVQNIMQIEQITVVADAQRSIKSIHARFRIPTATAWVICVESQVDCLIWRNLVIDAIWLSPIFRSPMKDFGYDISNYVDIDPLFGTMADFDALLAAAHEQGLRCFLISCLITPLINIPGSSKAGRRGGTPSATGIFGAIQRRMAGRPTTGYRNSAEAPGNSMLRRVRYYYHAFLSEQPDLNWRNPEVVDTMHEVMRFWLRKGVNGFRVDVIWHLIKDAQFRDNPVNPHYVAGQPPNQKLVPLYTTDLPEVHDVIRGLRKDCSTNFQSDFSSVKSTCH